jgi:sulfate permease, SulP family
VDMSSAEAFVRIHRLLAAKYVTLVFCGFTNDSPVGNALRSVDVLGADGVELFLTFNDAIECMLHGESFVNWRKLIFL